MPRARYTGEETGNCYNGLVATHIKVLAAGGLIFLLGAAAYHTLDPDFGWRVRTGEWILQNQKLPTKDLFSFTMPDYPWIDHAWLSSVLFALAHRHVPPTLLSGIIALLVAFPFIWWIWRVQNVWERITVFIAGLSLLLFMGVRAQFFSLFLFFVCWLIIEYRRLRPGLMALLPLLFFLWSMVHGGFVAGLFFLGLVFLIDLYQWHRGEVHAPELLLSGSSFILSSTATLVTPYGLRLAEEIAIIFFSRENARFISEWQPLPNFFFDPLIITLTAVSILFTLRSWKTWTVERSVPFYVFLAFALVSARNWYFFIIVALPILTESMSALGEEIKNSKPSRHAKLFAGILVSVALFVFIWGGGWWRVVSWRDRRLERYPYGALASLASLPPVDSTRLFNEYAWGGWLIFHTPHLKTFIDGRMPYWEEKEHSVMRDYVDVILLEKKSLEELVRQYDLNAALVPRRATSSPSWLERSAKRIAKELVSRDTVARLQERIERPLNFLRPKPQMNLTEEFQRLGWQVVYEDNIAVLLLAPVQSETALPQ